MARTRVDDSDDGQEIEVHLGSPWVSTPATGGNHNDPFNAPAEDIRKMDGLSPAFKKKVTRDIQKFQRGQNGAATKQETELTNTGYFKLDVAIPPYNMEYLGKLYEINAAHKASVDAKVANIVGLGYDLVESHKMRQSIQDTDSAEKTEKIRRKIEKAKNEIYEWVDGLNEEDTFTETLRRMWTDVEVMGNGYLEIGRTVTGEIGYMGHIPAQSIRMRVQRDGFVQIIGNKTVFFRNFGDTETPNPLGNDPRPNEIIHFKKYSPNNGYYGIPDILAAKNAIAGAEFAARYNLDYFEHKAVPRYMIIVKGATLSAASEAKLVEFFQTGLKGKNHRSMYIPLPTADAEFKMEPVEAGNLDASFGSYLKMCRDEILMAHRVPITKVGISEGASLAVARDADKTFKEQVCRPEQRIIEKKMNKIFSAVTDALRFKLNELTLTDEMEQAKIDEIYLRMQTRVPNEVRRRQGDPALPDGDKVVELKPQQAAEQRTQANGNRQRDQQRQSSGTDSRGEARNPQGEGRTNS